MRRLVKSARQWVGGFRQQKSIGHIRRIDAEQVTAARAREFFWRRTGPSWLDGSQKTRPARPSTLSGRLILLRVSTSDQDAGTGSGIE